MIQNHYNWEIIIGIYESNIKLIKVKNIIKIIII